MKEIVFATNNRYKLQEIRNIIGNNYTIPGLKDIHCDEEIPETAVTLEGNASLKAWYVHNKFDIDCFADDTGLEIEALNDRPGVHSARYAGKECIAENNMNKVLAELKGISNRQARFRTVISLILDGQEYQFEGIVNGKIIQEKKGKKGFGYDPIFLPDGYEKTFAEMTIKDKNLISHRAIATSKLVDFLNKI